MIAHPIPTSALDAHLAILGTTGGGKSVTARGIVERHLDRQHRVCVLDPVGVWWGLKANAAGDGPGYPVAVIGGDHADLPLHEDMGEPLAELVAGNNLPLVIDYSEMGVSERNRFLLAFLSTLYRLNKRALWLVIEEADEIAPQQVRPEGARLLDAVDKIARRGRSRGFRLISITQRPQVLNKNVLTQTRTMVAHRLTAPQDRKAVHDWIKAGAAEGQADEIMATLPSLATGEAWVWAQEADHLGRTQMPMQATFDSSRTPAADEAIVEPVRLAEVDLSAVEAALAPAADLAAGKDADVAKPTEAALKKAREEGYAAGFEAGRSEGFRHGEAAALARAQSALAALRCVGAPEDRAPSAPAEAPARKTKAIRDGDGSLPSSATKILAVLDTQPPIRMTWRQAASMAGLRPRGGHWNTGVKALREAGLVVEDGALVRIAQPTEAATAIPDGPERSRIMVGNWKRVLGGRAADVLAILERDGERTRDSIADELGVASRGGHWNTVWKSLRDNDLIDEARGVVTLADWLR